MRARITFSKTGALRYIGHLDLQTLWERAARRAGLPLAYSHGFHPQPKINFASPLPLGFSSRAEVLDMRLQSEVELGDLPRRLEAALPPGIRILGVLEVDEAAPALQTQVQAADYEVSLIEVADAAALEQAARRLMEATSLPRTRRGKPYDLRPLIEELRVESAGGALKILMRLSAREAATGRPEEVLDELGIAAGHARIERSRLIFQRESVEST
jgi:radical SAM-linked protein